ncbi:MAG TPA: alkaline phosphatase [Bacteroidales bacterium]|nr:alkaline phosphatase [Bacteroidales bacterium]
MKSLFRILVFAVAGLIVFSCNRAVKEEERQNVILFIGDGMGLAQLCAATGSVADALNIERCPYVGLMKTQSQDNYVTDSAAGATAFSTGHKTKNSYLAVDSTGNPLKTILEFAEDAGLSTGLVVTCAVTHATPAAFIAHQTGRENNEAIAADIIKTDVDVLIGGGRKYFESRSDGQNLISNLTSRGYTVPDSIWQIPSVLPEKLAWFRASGHMPGALNGRGDALAESVRLALNMLARNKKGFFLMVEGSQIDWACHSNDSLWLVKEVLDFDKAVGEGLKFASGHKNTTVIVLADHETGGVSLPAGDLKQHTVNIRFSSHDHTGIMVPVYASGPGASLFTGVYDNTAIFHKMMHLLKLKE